MKGAGAQPREFVILGSPQPQHIFKKWYYHSTVIFHKCGSHRSIVGGLIDLYNLLLEES